MPPTPTVPALDEMRRNPGAVNRRRKNRSVSARLVAVFAWSYLAAVLAALAMLKFAGDRWWPATLMTFGPRWCVLLPLPTLLPLALFFHRRALVPILFAALLGAGPVMGLCVPWRALLSRSPDKNAPALRVVTYNCGGGGADMAVVGEFLRQSRPDVLVVNEAGEDLHPKFLEVLGGNWSCIDAGATIFSRFPMVLRRKIGPEEVGKPWRNPALHVELQTPSGPIHVVAVHLQTPREGFEEMMIGRWRAIPAMIQTIIDRRRESELSCQLARAIAGPLIVAGDFNMPVDSTIYRQFWSPWQNAYSEVGWGYGHTKFTRRFGVRIDHVLASEEWRILGAQVGPDLGGDHRPVVVELQLKAID